MNEVITVLARTIPDLVVLAFIIITFLRHMAERDKQIVDLHNQGIQFIKQSTDDFKQVVRENSVVMKENLTVMGKVLERIEQ